MKLREFIGTMESLMAGARRETMAGDGRIVFVSDMHLGDRGPKDDFVRNEELVAGALGSYYLERGWRLVLNGDIEELHKFRFEDIRAAYADLFGLFRSFAAGPGLVKLVGNHDAGLLLREHDEFPVEHALRLDRDDGSVLVFHGHQSNKLYAKYNHVSDFIVRRVARPLGIPNLDRPVTNERRFRAERRIYRASRALGVVSIAGHTHRPLFESASKYDSLRWNIESLLRRYTEAGREDKPGIRGLLEVYVDEFKRLTRKERARKASRGLYERDELLVPCVFNSGCAMGSGGFTAIEIEGPGIALVYWSRPERVKPYIEREATGRDRFEGLPWARYTLARDSLDYVFARIKLLS